MSHAILSASASSRWLKCTKAPRLEAQLPDTVSEYAAAGTLAHEMAELKARKYFIEPMGPRTFGAKMKKFKEDPNYDSAIDANTDTYLEYLKACAVSYGTQAPFVALETRVDYGDYAPEGFGTADCIMIGSGKMHVIDYKNGSGVEVSADNNSQMMLYALGALKVYAPIYGDSIQLIHMAIVQPNAGGIKESRINRQELEDWGETIVKPAAALAWTGEGDFAPDPDPNGRCRFCRARMVCRAYADSAAQLAFKPVLRPELLDDTELGERLTLAMQFKAYMDALKEFVQDKLLAGGTVPGYKLVPGKSSRAWKGGTDAAFEGLMAAGVEEALLWERNPVTPPKLEKTLGKTAFAEIATPFVDKKPGAPTLAPESDPREAYNAAQTAFKVEA